MGNDCLKWIGEIGDGRFDCECGCDWKYSGEDIIDYYCITIKNNFSQQTKISS